MKKERTDDGAGIFFSTTGLFGFFLIVVWHCMRFTTEVQFTTEKKKKKKALWPVVGEGPGEK